MDELEPRRTADRAAAAAEVTVLDGPTLTVTQRRELAELFGHVWNRDEATMGPIVTGEILWAIGHVGCPVAAAFARGRMVGGTCAFVGVRDGVVRAHGHLAGVLPGHQGRGIGQALKWHQRAWCLENGIDVVEWTFDPLVRRNAVVNLVHLGARPVAHLLDVYGSIADARNRGVPSDRFLVRWDLRDARVQQAAAGHTAEPRLDGLRRAGAQVAVDVGSDDAPVVTPTTAGHRLVRIPADIETLRATRPDTAARWTEVFRDHVGTAMAEGSRVTGVTRDGWYVLAPGGGVAEMA